MNTIVLFTVINATASVVMALGVVVAARQLRLTKRQALVDFEDTLSREYRQIAAELPLEALLGESLPEQQMKKALPTFYRYFDLSNEQAFLHEIRRVSPETWKFWCDGIASNLRRPAFRLAWSLICARSNSDFKELRALFFPLDPPK